MKAFMLAFLAPSLTASGCTTYPGDAPIVENGQPLPKGTPVAIGQPVWAGHVVATPMALREDSRCPSDVQCIWAGRVVVTTRIDGPGWRQTLDMTLGESANVRGGSLRLSDVQPQRETADAIAPAAYRFGYDSAD